MAVLSRCCGRIPLWEDPSLCTLLLTPPLSSPRTKLGHSHTIGIRKSPRIRPGFVISISSLIPDIRGRAEGVLSSDSYSLPSFVFLSRSSLSPPLTRFLHSSDSSLECLLFPPSLLFSSVLPPSLLHSLLRFFYSSVPSLSTFLFPPSLISPSILFPFPFPFPPLVPSLLSSLPHTLSLFPSLLYFCPVLQSLFSLLCPFLPLFLLSPRPSSIPSFTSLLCFFPPRFPPLPFLLLLSPSITRFPPIISFHSVLRLYSFHSTIHFLSFLPFTSPFLLSSLRLAPSPSRLSSCFLFHSLPPSHSGIPSPLLAYLLTCHAFCSSALPCPTLPSLALSLPLPSVHFPLLDRPYHPPTLLPPSIPRALPSPFSFLPPLPSSSLPLPPLPPSPSSSPWHLDACNISMLTIGHPMQAVAMLFLGPAGSLSPARTFSPFRRFFCLLLFSPFLLSPPFPLPSLPSLPPYLCLSLSIHPSRALHHSHSPFPSLIFSLPPFLYFFPSSFISYPLSLLHPSIPSLLLLSFTPYPPSSPSLPRRHCDPHRFLRKFLLPLPLPSLPSPSLPLPSSRPFSRCTSSRSFLVIS
ncbi:hypothetical protein C7M84_025176 [Penaeus vannamei]|uniref:Uncharacterized protein n=1 Tax=Penaeus vannamei TaxID=6689 RepID=A0A3R7PSW4_PENVA|nr:hypothetical protein C7M84_025176 [Penaeus vannamei]